MRPVRLVLQMALACVVLGWGQLVSADDGLMPDQLISISEVQTSAATFSPAAGEEITLHYRLSAPAEVTVRAYDPDLEEIAVLAREARQEAGANAVRWDGRDVAGEIVPDEAYIFTIEARGRDGTVAVYDPTTFSGGQRLDTAPESVDPASGSIAYRLPRASRVLVRIGVQGSALLRTLVDWEPRTAGSVVEHWNGKDADGYIDVRDHAYSLLISYVPLPENSVITFGNDAVAFDDYKKAVAERPRKPRRGEEGTESFDRYRAGSSSFAVDLAFPGAEGDEAMRITEDARVAVDVPDSVRDAVVNQQFELIFFVDRVFFAEEESGYLPYTFPLEVNNLSPGRHVLTVNVATFGGEIGVASLPFIVESAAR